MKFWKWLRNHSVKQDIQTILHLPLWQRLAHRKARRPLAAVLFGVVLMVLGSSIAHSAAWIAELAAVPHVITDTVGYFLHAVGAVPAIRYVEPFWSVLVGAEATIEEVL